MGFTQFCTYRPRSTILLQVGVPSHVFEGDEVTSGCKYERQSDVNSLSRIPDFLFSKSCFAHCIADCDVIDNHLLSYLHIELFHFWSFFLSGLYLWLLSVQHWFSNSGVAQAGLSALFFNLRSLISLCLSQNQLHFIYKLQHSQLDLTC